MALRIEAHVPFRFRALLTFKERGQLDQAIIRFTTGGEKVLALLESTIERKHRIVKGTFFEGTFEYKDADGDDGNISAEDLIRSEFPGFCYDSGGAPLSGGEEAPVEFIMTGRFSVVLLKHEKGNGVRLLVRRGLVEMDFNVLGALPSIAEAILSAERDSGQAAKFLAPISAEIVNCNMLGG